MDLRPYRRLVILIACLCFAVAANAQTVEDSTSLPLGEETKVVSAANKNADSAAVVKDTVKRPFQPNPKKAGMYSALLPGSGQIYNRQYWKAPVIYAVFGVAGYFIANNYKEYNRYRTAYIAVIDNDPNTVSTELYGENDLKTTARPIQAVAGHDRTAHFCRVYDTSNGRSGIRPPEEF